MFPCLRITVNVPLKDADAIRQAIGQAGAGKIGDYAFCSFSMPGQGRCLPLDGAHPAIGQVGHFELIEEEQVEVVCEEALLQEVLTAIRKAHPYEEPVILVHPVYRA